MVGVITGREVVHNAGVICHEFGVGCFLRCMWVVASRKQTTFLEVACPAWSLAPAHNDDGRDELEASVHGGEDSVKH